METLQTEHGSMNIVLFEGALFRADTFLYEKPNPNANAAKQEATRSPRLGRIRMPRFNTAANNAYTQTPIKYFTASREEALSYAKRGAPYLYTWATREPLRLLNMYDFDTHATVLKTVQGNALNAVRVAFPANTMTRKVYRQSTPETQAKNDVALKSMCEMEGVDGYFIPRQEGAYSFHSEIGLCRNAFSKLRLVQIENTGLSAVNRVGQSWMVGEAPAAIVPVNTKRRSNGNSLLANPTRRLFGNASPVNPTRLLFGNASPVNPTRRLFGNNRVAGRKRSRNNMNVNDSNNGLALPPPIYRRRTLRK